MEIVTDIHNFTSRPCAAAIGSFDGVHLGHRAMLGELKARAVGLGLPVAVVTFARHPRTLFDCDTVPFLLSTNDEKVALLESLGVDICVMLDFDKAMASMSAERFMNEVLSGCLGVKQLCIGYDHHFGKPQEGEGFEQYVEYGKPVGIELFMASPYYINGDTASSSKIRRALGRGDIENANSLLGRGYSFSGKVVHGAGLGRSIGFPTANVELDDVMKLLPADGVYAVRVACCGSSYKGVMNIGVKPTIGKGLLRTVEVFLIGYSGDLYGRRVSVEVVQFVRGEVAFDCVDALSNQIEADVDFVNRNIVL